MMTSTFGLRRYGAERRKLRREFMEEKYKDLIQAMYGNLEEVPVQAQVTYRDGRKGPVSTDIKVRDV